MQLILTTEFTRPTLMHKSVNDPFNMLCEVIGICIPCQRRDHIIGSGLVDQFSLRGHYMESDLDDQGR